MTDIKMVLLIVCAVFSALACLLSAIAVIKSGSRRDNSAMVLKEIESANKRLREELNSSMQLSMSAMATALSEAQRQNGEIQDKRLKELNEQLGYRNELLHKTVNRQLAEIEARIKEFTQRSENSLENMRRDNSEQLEKMRQTVDEKLQKTLSERLDRSFEQVSKQLEQVYIGLGEMKTLANGVGDLKKVLSNVKTRGILGEIQLGAILEQILSPEQYEANVCTKIGSQNVVEYAVKLPGNGEETVWLPIDAKFPADCYADLMQAYDSADSDAISAAGKELERRIKACAKDIHDKYIDPPNTTDFAVMFLPFEGLYAEVVRRGMVEILTRDYKVNIAGPTTMAALLNSLQMGFRTLAIQKRSGEVWRVLGEVKTEFANFNGVLIKAQDKIRLANSEIDKLVGTRTRAIERKLREVEALPAAAEIDLLPEGDNYGES